MGEMGSEPVPFLYPVCVTEYMSGGETAVNLEGRKRLVGKRPFLIIKAIKPKKGAYSHEE